MIDTVRIFTKDFEVDSGARLKLKPGVVDIESGQTEGSNWLYRDKSGNDIQGSGAYLNSDKYNLDIDKYGLKVKFTPAKGLYGCNYYSINNSQLAIVSEEIQRDLQDHGIHLNLHHADVSRLDLARNIHTEQPVKAYEQLFGFLNGKRMKSAHHPGYHRFGNRARQCVFYDKLQEVERFQGVDLSKHGIPNRPTLRGELRFLNGRTVKRDLECSRLSELYNKDCYEGLRDKYRHYLRELVFRHKGECKLSLNYQQELEFLRELREMKKRNVVADYLAIRSIDRMMEMFGDIETFRTLLIDAGFYPKYADRQMKQLRERLDLWSRVKVRNTDEEKTVSRMYEEVTDKLLN